MNTAELDIKELLATSLALVGVFLMSISALLVNFAQEYILASVF